MHSSQDYGPLLVVNYAMAPTPNIEISLDLQQNTCRIIPQGYTMIKKRS